MGENDEEVRIAVTEQRLDAIEQGVKRIEEKLDTYNQYRERVDNLTEAVKSHVTDGKWWRGSIIGVGVTLVLAMLGWAVLYGKMSKTVELMDKYIVSERMEQ